MDWKTIGFDEVSVAGLAAGAVRYMMTSTKRSFKEILMAILVAWLVAEASHPWMVELCLKWGLGEDSAVGATGVLAFLAPDLLQGLLNMGKTIREDGFVALVNKFRGK